MLGEAGATVYCTGRSIRGKPATGNRPETIEETAEMVTAHGGRGIHGQVDHTDKDQVKALFERVKIEHGRLDVLVNDVWGGDELTEFGKPFWKHSLDKGLLMQQRAVFSHIITSHYAVPLMIEHRQGLVIEVTDGNHFWYRASLFYDLAKISVIRLAFAMAYELRCHNITALAITPGFLRSETVLEQFGVEESNWEDAVNKDPSFKVSESPCYVGRAIAALAADPNVSKKSGRVFSSWDLALEYGFVDVDGRQPDFGKHYRQKFGEPIKSCDETFYEYWFGGPAEKMLPPWPEDDTRRTRKESRTK